MRFKALWKDTFRELSNSVMRFLAILFIIFLGVGLYIGLSATSPNMVNTADEYFSKLNLMDFKIQSTYGLTNEDIEDLENIADIQAQSHYAYDFIVEDYAETIRLYSYDIKNGQAINDYYVVEGRLPEKTGEVAIDSNEQFLSGLQIGDTLTLETGKDAGEPEENLNRQSFEVVGFVTSPLFVELPSRGTTTIASGTLNGFGVIAQEDYDTEYISEIYLVHEDAQSKTAYSDEYDDFIEGYSPELTEFLDGLETRRADEIQKEAQNEIDDGWQEIEEAEQELVDAEQELKDARAELDDGWQQLEDGRRELEEQTSSAQEEIDRNETQLQEALSELNSQEQELREQKQELQAQLAELEENQPQLEDGIKQLEDGIGQVDEGLAEIEAQRSQIYEVLQEQGINDKEELLEAKEMIEETLEDPLVPEPVKEKLREQLNGINNALAGLEQLDEAEQDARAQKEELTAQLNELYNQRDQLVEGIETIQNALPQIEDGLAQIEDGRTQINDGIAEIEEAKETLATEKANGQNELDDAEAELNDGEAEYEDGLATFEEEREEAEAELADAKKELEEAEADLDSMADPEYLLFDRTDNPGYLEYSDNADRLSIISKVFPVFFFLIAIFISFTTMTRMVDEEREYIGIMKALGYANQQILIKFITYASLATIVGVVLGLAIGYLVLPQIIFYAYASMYNFPYMTLQQYTLYTVLALIASFISTVGASLIAVNRSLRSNAAILLQPKAPKHGTHIWLEKIPLIWKRLSFNLKITFRNVFRYKSRMWMAILGIAGSTGLVLTGFGISDSVSDVPNIQFGEINQFQAYVALDSELSSDELKTYTEKIQDYEQIDQSLFITEESTTADGDGINKQDVSIFVPENPSEIGDFIKLTDYKDDTIHELDDSGAYVTQKIAQLLDAEAGDEIEVTNSDDEVWTIKIAGIVENYIGHTIYMTPEYFAKVTNSEPAEPNMQLIKYDEEATDVDGLGSELMSEDEVLGISYVTDIYEGFSGTLDSLNTITYILVVAAAALAFVILYNLTNINVSERKRELSTIKVLGSYDNEVTMYIYRENIILTVLGIVFGLVFGTVLTNFTMSTMEVDMLVFGRSLHLSSYLYSILLTVLFTIIVMLVIHRQLKRIDMVEALKAND